MQITRRRLKEIIKEEMDHLAETGDLEALTESEKMAFQIILEKLSPEQLKEMGLQKIQLTSTPGPDILYPEHNYRRINEICSYCGHPYPESKISL